MAVDGLTWVGHATVLADLGGHRILTDPLLTHRASHLRRRVPAPGVDLTGVDAVLISHLHVDHLHARSLRRIASGSPEVTVVVPRGGAGLVPQGLRVAEVVPGEALEIGGVRVVVTEAEHNPERGPFSRVRATPVGYVVAHAGRRLYFAGDTDLFAGMSELGPVDVAAIPVGGWWKTLGVGHLDPRRAAEATVRVDPRVVVPIHWGTYAPELGPWPVDSWFGKPGPEFARKLSARGLADRLALLPPGGSVPWPVPPPGGRAASEASG